MKKAVVVRTMVALMLSVVTLSSAGLAQGFDHKVRAEIPFNFYAADKMLPSGSYTLAFNTENHSLMIINDQNGQGAVLMGSAADGAKPGLSVLTFRASSSGAYVLENLKTDSFALSFHSKRLPSYLASGSKTDSAPILIAAR